MATFKDRLKELRKEAGLNQEQLAPIIGVASNTISRWERGENKPDAEKLLFMSQYFHVSVAYLEGITDDRHDPILTLEEQKVAEDEAQKIDEEHLLTLFRRLSPEMKRMILNMVNNAYLVDRDRLQE